MRKVDPSITPIASGNMLEAMDLTGEMRAKDVDNLKALGETPQLDRRLARAQLGQLRRYHPTLVCEVRPAL
jgi:hypothetical protein